MSANERAHVLIVDDTPENIQVLMETLKQDYTLAAATSGEKALALATGRKLPDIILLDVMMPGIDGYETCRRLKANERTAAIPVLFITGMSQAADEAHGLALGAVDYITKPFSHELVKARIANHLSLYRTRLDLERKHYESGRANAQLKRQNEMMREILGHTVHGLRNQLTVISGFVQLLGVLDETAPTTPEKRRNMLSRMTTAVGNMGEAISGILTLERLESTSIALDCRLTDIAALVASVCELNQAHASSKNISIIADLPGGLHLTIDSQHIRDVADNLISNAIKFSPKGKRLWVQIVKQADTCQLLVKDEGPGMSPDDLTKIFGRFQILSARPTAGEASSGLGLSIVKRLVELHGGTVTVASQLGEGTTFTVTLPFRPV